jgi:23S rRNA pseudouridine2605 synthase
MHDKHAARKVTDLVQIPGVRLVPAGRLDADSEGLMLLSNDGDFVYRVTHPSQSLNKIYHVTIPNGITPEVIQRLTRGLLLPGETRATAPARVRKLGRGDTPGTTLLEMTLHEGRNRQIRRMLETVGFPVQRLVRVQIGTVCLGILGEGEWRDLTKEEIASFAANSPPTNEGKKTTIHEISNRSRPRPRSGQSHRKSPEKRS